MRGGSCIHNVAYADDVVRVIVEKVLEGFGFSLPMLFIVVYFSTRSTEFYI